MIQLLSKVLEMPDSVYCLWGFRPREPLGYPEKGVELSLSLSICARLSGLRGMELRGDGYIVLRPTTSIESLICEYRDPQTRKLAPRGHD